MVQDWTGLDLGGIFMATFYIQLLELLVVRACKVCKARVCVDSAPSSCSDKCAQRTHWHNGTGIGTGTGTDGGTRRRLAQQQLHRHLEGEDQDSGSGERTTDIFLRALSSGRVGLQVVRTPSISEAFAALGSGVVCVSSMAPVRLGIAPLLSRCQPSKASGCRCCFAACSAPQLLSVCPVSVQCIPCCSLAATCNFGPANSERSKSPSRLPCNARPLRLSLLATLDDPRSLSPAV